MDWAGVILAFGVGLGFLVLAATTRVPEDRVTRRRRLLVRLLRLVYLVAGLLLVVRGAIALTAA